MEYPVSTQQEGLFTHFDNKNLFCRRGDILCYYLWCWYSSNVDNAEVYTRVSKRKEHKFKKKITGLTGVHKSKSKNVLWAKMMAIPASAKLQAYFKNYLRQLKIIASGKMKEF